MDEVRCPYCGGDPVEIRICDDGRGNHLRCGCSSCKREWRDYLTRDRNAERDALRKDLKYVVSSLGGVLIVSSPVLVCVALFMWLDWLWAPFVGVAALVVSMVVFLNLNGRQRKK